MLQILFRHNFPTLQYYEMNNSIVTAVTKSFTDHHTESNKLTKKLLYTAQSLKLKTNLGKNSRKWDGNKSFNGR